MSHNLLTEEELNELTGSPQRKKQIAVLVKHGINFITRTDGKIKTTWQAVNSVLEKSTEKQQTTEPDLDFLRQ